MSEKLTFGTMRVTPKAYELVNEALASGRLSCGKYVREFEEKFAAIFGVKEAVAVSSGTDADVLALASLYEKGAQRGDEIIVPALSFVAVANAVLQAGFKPVFVDIEATTLNIAPHLIERVINDRTKAILLVHNLGKPCDMSALVPIAFNHGLFLIEDTAEGYGGEYKGLKLGTIGYMGTFSLYVAHSISSIEGGMIITDDSQTAGVLRSLRSHGRACNCKQCVLNTTSGYCAKRFAQGEDIRFITERVGYSCKMNELEAAIGLGTLDIYDEILAKRQVNLKVMMKIVERYPDYLYTLCEEPYERVGPHALAVIVNAGAPFTRNELAACFERNGIDCRGLFQCTPNCKGYEFLGYRPGEFPVAEYIEKHGLHIGVHQDVTPQQIEYFGKVLASFIEEHTHA